MKYYGQDWWNVAGAGGGVFNLVRMKITTGHTVKK